jgi:hypothetical protein
MTRVLLPSNPLAHRLSPLVLLVLLVLSALSALACGKSTPSAAAPTDPTTTAAPATAAATAPAPSSSTSGNAAFCDTFKSKCTNAPAITPDDVALCKQLVTDAKCGAQNLAAMQCDQRVETCRPDGKPTGFAACHAEHSAAEACGSAAR